jgi:phosphonatase-like hydrolase
MNRIQLVVCDMAGTTLHDGDAVRKAFEAALAGAKLAAPVDRINAVMGLPKKIAVRQLLAELGHPANDAVVDSLHDDFVARMKHYYSTDPGVREIPGAAATLATLRERGIKVALNTGFSRDIVDVILPRLGWSAPATVNAVVTSDEVPRGRPHPDMIQYLMAELGVSDVKHVAKIGDTIADLEEGINAGCGLNIGVLTGSATRAELSKLPHTHILNSICDALPIAELAQA